MPSPNEPSQALTPEQGAALVALARRTLTERFGGLAGPFRPIGETDSELAFCHLANRMSVLWSETEDGPPSLHRRLRKRWAYGSMPSGWVHTVRRLL